MTLGGWIFMAASWLVILSLAVYTLSRTLRQKDALLPGHKDPPSSEEP